MYHLSLEIFEFHMEFILFVFDINAWYQRVSSLYWVYCTIVDSHRNKNFILVTDLYEKQLILRGAVKSVMLGSKESQRSLRLQKNLI
jgi:hypothetical protein